MIKFKFFILISIFFLISGCYYKINIDRDFEKICQETLERTYTDIDFNPPIEQQESQILDTLEKGITRNGAVVLALKNNKKLLAKFAELGIRKSEYLQALLFHNPHLQGSFNAPSVQCASDIFNIDALNLATDKEFSITFPVSDLWQKPLEQRVAFDELHLKILDILMEILDTVRLARKAYDEVMVNLARVKTFKQGILVIKELKKYFKWRQKNAHKKKIYYTAMSNYLVDIEYAKRRRFLVSYTGRLYAAYAKLRGVLGLSCINIKPIKILDKLKNICLEVPPVEYLVKTACASRPELHYARINVKRYEDMVKYEQSRFLRKVEMGVGTDNDIADIKTAGPTINLELPAFDYNQAQISKAMYNLEKAKRELIAKKIKVQARVYYNHTHVTRLIKVLNIYNNDIVYKAILAKDFVRKYYKTAKFDTSTIIQTYISLRQAKRQYLSHFVEYLNFYAELERLVGKRIDIRFACDEQRFLEKSTPKKYFQIFKKDKNLKKDQNLKKDKNNATSKSTNKAV